MSDWWTSDPVAPAATGAGAPAASPEEFLKTLAAPDAATVQGLANYKINPTSLSTKGGHREFLLGKTLQYDPSYDQAGYNAKAAAIKEFNAGGPSSPAGQITAGNTAIQHLHEMAEAAKRLKELPGFLHYVESRGIPFLSYAAAAMKNAALKGTPEGQALADFMTAANHYSEEVTKFYAGSGGSESERGRALANLDPAKSLPELLSAFKTEGNLMSGKINALQDRFKTAMGPKAWLTAVEGAGTQFPILQQKSQEALQKIHALGEPPKQDSGSSPFSEPDADGWMVTQGGRIREMKPSQ